jgi:3-keto-5-aminohexanoate cleavage enzyme
MRKVWIEAALNGGWSRALQPGIPDTVEAIIAEGVACARAGATIVHVHAYDGGGPQTHDWQVYARIIEGIRNEVDVPVYPSYPALMTNGDASLADAAVRFAHVEALVARGLIEFAIVDPGSANFTLTKTTAAAPPAGTYMNPEDHVRHALDFSARHGLHPDFAIYEPGGLWRAPKTDIRNHHSPLEHAASQLIGKASIAETLGEGGEVLLPTKQISQIGGAQIGITFECL